MVFALQTAAAKEKFQFLFFSRSNRVHKANRASKSKLLIQPKPCLEAVFVALQPTCSGSDLSLTAKATRQT